MSRDWDIKRRSEECEGCEKDFAEGQAYMSRLVFGLEGYARSDFCENCWSNVAGEAHLSAWRGVFRAPPPPPPDPTLEKDTAESLLRRLIEEKDDATINAIYILSLMLERKKILVNRGSESEADGMLLQIYEHAKTGETFVVRDPQLRLHELEPVQQEVAAMLGPPPEHAAPEEAASESPDESSPADEAEAADASDPSDSSPAQPEPAA